jgi:hypothetical protein
MAGELRRRDLVGKALEIAEGYEDMANRTEQRLRDAKQSE